MMYRKIKNITMGYIEKYGWKTALAFFICYLIRDVSLYIIVPWLIAKNIL